MNTPLADVQEAMSHVARFDLTMSVGNDEEGFYTLGIAHDHLVDAEKKLEAETRCECNGGIIWPMSTDGNDDHHWIERCDTCEKFDSDDEAALALGRRFGVKPNWTWHPTLNRPAPYLDVGR